MDGFLRPQHSLQNPRTDIDLRRCPELENPISAICQECPNTDCLHDKRHADRQQRIQERAGAMYRRYKQEKQTVQEIAVTYRVSTRTVQRALAMVNRPRPAAGRETEEE